MALRPGIRTSGASLGGKGENGMQAHFGLTSKQFDIDGTEEPNRQQQAGDLESEDGCVPDQRVARQPEAQVP